MCVSICIYSLCLALLFCLGLPFAHCAVDFRSVNLRIITEKNVAVVHLPGFKYDDFDRAGTMTVSNWFCL